MIVREPYLLSTTIGGTTISPSKKESLQDAVTTLVVAETPTTPRRKRDD